MPKYRKKPVVVEAFQLNAFTVEQFPEWFNESEDWFWSETIEGGLSLIIATLEGEMAACQGDYIIQGVQGEIYPCKPDIFEATYEAVLEADGD